MKKLINFFKSLILFKKVLKATGVASEVASDMNSNDEPEATQVNSKKEVWKFIIQTIISILTAILTALGASSCVHHIIF